MFSERTTSFFENFMPRVDELQLSELESELAAEGLSCDDFSEVYSTVESWTKTGLLQIQQEAAIDASNFGNGLLLKEELRAQALRVLTEEGYQQSVVSLKLLSEYLDIDFGTSKLKPTASQAFYDLCLAALAFQFEWPDYSVLSLLNRPANSHEYSQVQVTLNCERRFSENPNLHNVFRDEKGVALSRESNFGLWTAIRKQAISATDATKLLKKNGEPSAQRKSIIESKAPDFEGEHYGSYDLGIEREPIIADWVARAFPKEGYFPNDYLYATGNNRHVATPDMVGHSAVCEIKVSVKSLQEILPKYLDQMQWQMYVLNFEKCLFVVENRENQTIETNWVQRNQVRVDALIKAADEVLESSIASRKITKATSDQVMPGDGPHVKHERSQAYLHESHVALLFGSNSNEPYTAQFSRNDLQHTLNLYSAGMSVSEISNTLSRSKDEILVNLGAAIFRAKRSQIRKSDMRGASEFSLVEAEFLAKHLDRGKSIKRMARSLGRDQLEVLEYIFDSLRTIVSRKISGKL